MIQFHIFTVPPFVEHAAELLYEIRRAGHSASIIQRMPIFSDFLQAKDQGTRILVIDRHEINNDVINERNGSVSVITHREDFIAELATH